MKTKPSTFSIVAYDRAENAWGVAVASKFLAVGALVPWAAAGQGAVATQSYANTSFGPRGLDLMSSGLSAQKSLERLLQEDEGRDLRQAGFVDARGGAASFTGSDCYPWAGSVIGDGFTCQGNILVGEATVQAMAETFTRAPGELADRLIAALTAGEAAGGDARGRQSAAVLVVKPAGGYGGFNDRYLDLRVDDDTRPVQRLAELVEMHHLYFNHSRPEDRLRLEGRLLGEVQDLLAAHAGLTGHEPGELDESTRRALDAFIGRENLEERVDAKAGLIDPPAWEYMKQKYR